MADVHHTRRYRACVLELKSRGRWQKCWSCGRPLDAKARRPDPNRITLGHYVAVEDAPHLAYEPSNYGPQCGGCNSADGGRRGLANRYGKKQTGIRTSPDWT